MKTSNSTRQNRGFTMAEMLIVVGITVVLLGVAFVAVINHQRSLKQFELDKTAREIFVAAQNHLTMAESQGILEQKTLKGAQPGDTEGGDLYYYFVAPSDPELSNLNSVLSEMLPQFSLDNTVRWEGSYVIEYNLKTATVTNVFYSDQSNLSEHVFAESDYDTLFPGCVGEDQEAKDNRFSYQDAIIGWYNGSDLEGQTLEALAAPLLQVINAERLEVLVSFDQANVNLPDAKLQVIIVGDVSGSSRVVYDESLARFSVSNDSPVVLDDITTRKKHFCEQFCTVGSNGTTASNAFIPGEDITIYAQVYSNEKLASIERSAKKHTNSLFDSTYERTDALTGDEAVSVGGGSTTTVTRVAAISNIRHLENMDATISGYDPEALKDADATPATSFEQTANLRWAGQGSDGTSAFTSVIAEKNSTEASKVRVQYLANNVATNESKYAPVQPRWSANVYGALEYDGGGYQVAGVAIQNNDDAGMFSTVEDGKIKNLQLVDFSVAHQDGVTGKNAGALAGTLTNTTVEGVFAYNEVANDDGKLEVAASGNAGGLVGSMNGGSVAGSSASVYVKSTGAAAGGLVGETTGTATIDKCYAGGHTVNGAYLDKTDANIVGRYNVQAQVEGEAGGLIGKTTGTTTITNSYATTSAYGGTVGGLVGSSAAGSITNCYAVGRVGGSSATASVGAFVGTKGTTTFPLVNNAASNHYLKITNAGSDPEVQPLSTGTDAGIAAADESVSTYNDFYSKRFSVDENLADSSNLQKALPYDSTLVTKYNKQYPFKSTGELANSEFAAESVHYGDWPATETNAINVKGMAAGSSNATNSTSGRVVTTLAAPVGGVSTAKASVAVPNRSRSVSARVLNWAPEGNSDAGNTSTTSTTETVTTEGETKTETDDGNDDNKKGSDEKQGEEGTSEQDKEGTSEQKEGSGTESDTSATNKPEGTVDSSEPKNVEPKEEVKAPKVLEKTLQSVDGHTYTIRVTYDEGAGIPEGTELTIIELNQIPDDWNDEEKQRTDYKDRPYSSERLYEADAIGQHVDQLTKTLELDDNDRLLWNKFLDAALVADGAVVVPTSDITVEIETDAVAVSESDAVEVATIAGDDSKRLEVQNATGSKDEEKDKKAEELHTRISFKTSALGEFGLAEVVEQKFNWLMHGDDISVFGARPVKAVPHEVPLDFEFFDGLHLVQVFEVEVDPAHTFETALWIEATNVEDEDETVEGEGILGYRIDGDNCELLFGVEGTDGLKTFESDNLIALVWDSGYREQVMQLMAVAPQANAQVVEGTNEGDGQNTSGGDTTNEGDGQSGSRGNTKNERQEGNSDGPFTITWVNYDNAELAKYDKVEKGTTPEYLEEQPTKPSDDTYAYTFSGWTPEIVAAVADATYKATYDAHPFVCKVGTDKYLTLNDAIAEITRQGLQEATIEMLMDYTMPASDALTIPPNTQITLKSATNEGSTDPFVITRGADLTDASMFINQGTLNLQGIVLDGGSVSASKAMITNSVEGAGTGTLSIGEGATLRNAVDTGNGGAVYSAGGSIAVSGSTFTNNKAAAGGVFYMKAGSLAITGGSFTGNTATQSSGGVVFAETASITVSGGSFGGTGEGQGNSATQHGGVVYIQTGTIELGGSASMTVNSATDNGGAVYAGSATVEVKGQASLSNNTAVDGGAIYSTSGSVTLSGGTLASNTASGLGGAVYASSAQSTVTVSGATLQSNAATNGGAIYADFAAVSVSDGTIEQNRAEVSQPASGQEGTGNEGQGQGEQTGDVVDANGGAIYAKSGTVNISGGTLTRNTATNGGALYAGSGAVTISGGELTANEASGSGGAVYTNGGLLSTSDTNITGNTATTNGSALYVAANRANLSGGTVISQNVATNGGAVGVGSTSVRLTFDGTVQIQNNKLGEASSTQQSNVYLDQDTDTVLYANKLSNSAVIGVYIPDDLANKRGVPAAQFASYSNGATNLGKFSNDRTPNLSSIAGFNNKIVWNKAIKVEVRYVQSFVGGLPPTVTGTVAYSSNAYYPQGKDLGVSEIATDLYKNISGTYATAGFGCAFADGATLYSEYLTRVVWDGQTGVWKFVRRDGQEITSTDKLIVYFSEPSYISFENNTNHTLTINPLTVMGVSVVNSNDTAGYGYVLAKNGAMQKALLPVTAEDLTLGANKSIKLLIPGAVGQTYSFTGKYANTLTDPVPLRRTGHDIETISIATALAGFTRSDPLANKSGGTINVILGGDKPICKIVTDRIEGVDPSEIVDQTDSNISGKVEYRFSTLNQAVTFAQTHSLTTVAIEMLVDYLMPGTDIVKVPTGFDMTFNTALSGVYQYDHEPDDENPRATISRDTTNLSSFISAIAYKTVNGKQEKDTGVDYGTTLTVRDLIMDGKALVGKGDGGAVATLNCKTRIYNVDFSNFNAGNGGAVYVEYGLKNKTTYVVTDENERNKLIVEDVDFANCISSSTKNREGGGAVWTNAKYFELRRGTFSNCSAWDQGGAVFHRIDKEYTAGTRSTVEACSFTGCEARAAGGFESDAQNVEVTNGCRFEHCKSTQRSGGALNTYIWDENNPSKDCTVTVTDCWFEDCHANRRDNKACYGGGLRSNAKETTVQGCTFIDVSVDQWGGAIGMTNSNATKANVLGCTIEAAHAGGDGGGVYVAAKEFTVGEYNGTATSITDCSTDGIGGGIYHDKNAAGSFARITGVTISDCTSAGVGGGIRSNARELTLTSSTISGCKATGNGGAVWYDEIKSTGNRASMVLTIDGCSFESNETGGKGGGIYTKAARLNVLSSAAATSKTQTSIKGCKASDLGGGIAYENNGSTIVALGDCIIDGNSSNGGTGGGGVYADAGSLTLSGTQLLNNSASGSGGGLHYGKAAGTLAITSCNIRSNAAGTAGGGVWSAANVSVATTTITSNRLTTGSVGSAAGMYMSDTKTLTLGSTGADILDSTTISGNYTATGLPSNLRLSSDTDGRNKTNSIYVLCGLNGIIGVANANTRGVQFGSSAIAYPAGFAKDVLTGKVPVFQADDGSIYGITDRLDENGKKIVWAADPICKITDAGGTLLYFKASDSSTNLIPAVFDSLDNGKGAGNSNADKTGAFAILKYDRNNLKLYYSDGTRYGDDVSENEFHVKMLVENYTATRRIATNVNNQQVSSNPWMKIVLTTAGRSDQDGYPYRGKGTRATITRAAGYEGYALISPQVCLTLQNIVLDGNSSSVTATSNGGLIYVTDSQYTTVEVGADAILQNSYTTKDGGAVFLDWGNFVLDGGTIRNCTADGKGGAVDMVSWYKTTSGPVRGYMNILSGSIQRCSAAEGGGVYLGNNGRLTMSGGSITNNSATTKGGGIAFDSSASVVVYFSDLANVSNNRLNGALCNVHLDRDSYAIINSSGVADGARIGVYVPDGADLFDKHGGEGDPFGTYAAGSSTDALYSFVNDREGLKGGLVKNGLQNTIYWVQVYSLRVGKTVVSDLDGDTDKQFRFYVELLDSEGQVDTSVNETYGSVAFHEGRSDEIVLKGGETKLLEDLPLHQPYRVTEILEGDDAADFNSDPQSRQVAGTVEINYDKTGEDRYITDATITNTRKTGNLKVSKAVVSNADADKQESFTFRVTLDGLTDDAKNKTYGDVKFEDGVGEFMLTDEQSKTIPGLPSDAVFTVEEVLSPERQSYYSTFPVLTQNGTTLNESPSASTSLVGTIVDGSTEVSFTNRKNTSFTVSKTWADSVTNKDDFEIDFELFKVSAKAGDARWGQTGYDVPDLPDALVDLSYVWEDHVDTTSNVDIGQTFKFFKYNGKYYYFQISGQSYYNENMSAEEFLNAYVRNEDSSPIVMYTGRVWDLDMLKQGIADGTYRIYNNSIWMSTSPDPNGDKVHIAIGDLIFYDNQYYLVAKGADYPLFNYDQNTGEYTFAAAGRVGPDNNLRAVQVTGGGQGSGSGSSGEVHIEYSEQATAVELINTLTDAEHNYDVSAVPNTAADAVAGGYYTLNKDNDWTITFDDLDYRYSYYAVEEHIRPYGDRDLDHEVTSNYIITYSYVQDDHATIINTPAGSREVILRKVGQTSDGNYVSLAGAHFRIFNDNGTAQGGAEVTDGQPEGKDYYESVAPSGVYFVGTLPYGDYKIVETEYPDGYAPTNCDKDNPETWFYYTLKVDEDGAHIEGPKAYDGSDVIPPEAQYAVILNPEGTVDGVYYEGQSTHASLQQSLDGGKSYHGYEGTISWSTSDASVVSVAENGMLTMVGEGQATITGTDTEDGAITASKVITVGSPEETSLSTGSLYGIVGPQGMVGAAGTVVFTYRVNGQPTDITGHTLTFDGYDSSLIDVSVQAGVATVTYKATGRTSINVAFDGIPVGTVAVEIKYAELKTTSLSGTAGTTENGAIQVEYRIGNEDKSSEVPSHLSYGYDPITYGVAEVLADKTSVKYNQAGTTSIDVKFDGTTIGSIAVSVEPASQISELSGLFDIRQGPAVLDIEGNVGEVDVYTWPVDAANQYLASKNYADAEKQREVSVPAGRVFEQGGDYYYFKESVSISLGNIVWNRLANVRTWGLQDKILVVSAPNGQGGGGGLESAPANNAQVTSEQGTGSAIVGWENGNTWHSSSDGSYLYASSNTDQGVAIVYHDGHYYVPKSYGNVTRIDGTMFGDSFAISHLTDSTEHQYSPNNNPYYIVRITWEKTQ